MPVFTKELDHFDPLRDFSAVRERPCALFLDSADLNHPRGRYSFIAFDPVETVEVKNSQYSCISRESGNLSEKKQTISASAGKADLEFDPFALVRERLNAHRITGETIEGLPPFQGGAAGFFGYDLGRALEDLPATAKDNPGMPDMAVGIYNQVLAYDHAQQKAWVITHAENENIAQKKQAAVLEVLSAPAPLPAYDGAALEWRYNFEETDYKNRIRKIIEYIRDGDIFQANLSQRFDADLPGGFNAFAHYLHLRTVNPAPYAGFMNLGEIKISSASPECFLTVQNGEVETRPIKGTRRRSDDPAQDQRQQDDLLACGKDRAENTMIVDLLRNDLSKVCDPNSVEVTDLCALESFARVHHLVSGIRGELQKKHDALDLLRACFPGGSITGAPKIRAMDIIEELEPTRRGPYCGVMGYIGFDGSMDTNILIRTLVYEKGRVSFQTGGGIVADSNPDSEYQECFDKAAAIFQSFEGRCRKVENIA